ncbi:hypothetical protein [Microlunatus sp. GCM10028923]|uniref:hypothetical protein n=1 Tax=Microlunatus sp. GCM10028923 TaxID=3273400 RepID=UPI00361B7DD7
MLEMLRDSAFTSAWFGLMAMVWFGWAQEAPPPRTKPLLIAGSVLGVLLAAGFGVYTGLHWGDPTALNETGRMRFGIVVGIEVAAAGIGCLVFARLGARRWMAWWVAVVVALHFLSLAWIFGGWGLVLLGLVQVAGLAWLAYRIKGQEHPTSRWVGPLMGVTILLFGLVNGVVTLARG